ncbi:hypothetical protein [Neptuniibacter sp. QD48_11]|uniref:hypothetical protein n=1 Tax=Neptuniibacter sp. QD48_11 TaxID=3398211 RepID=UPI0039F4DBD9
MARIDSTEALKPHEKALKQLRLDESLHQLLRATLGIEEFPSNLLDLLENRPVKQVDQVSNYLSALELKKLPPVKTVHEKSQLTARWVKDDGELVIQDESAYAKQLDHCANIICPDWLGIEDEIPVTILIPTTAQEVPEKITGSESNWDFISIQLPEEQDLLASKLLSRADRANIAVRLYLSLQFLGMVSAQQSARNGSRICQELLASFQLSKYFSYLDGADVKGWAKKQKRKVELEENQLQRLQAKIQALKGKRETEAQFNAHQRKVKELSQRIAMVESEIEALGSVKKPTRIKPNSKSAFYYSIPDMTLKRLGLMTENKTDAITFPALAPTVVCPKYTSVRLGLPKEKDPTSTFRTAKQLRIMLSYLCPMTSGTAITFRVPRWTNGEEHEKGITSPTLILPEVWSDLALGLKKHTNNKTIQSMSTESYESSGLQEDFESAIYGNYDTREDELLRVLPTIDNQIAKEF